MSTVSCDGLPHPSNLSGWSIDSYPSIVLVLRDRHYYPPAKFLTIIDTSIHLENYAGCRFKAVVKIHTRHDGDSKKLVCGLRPDQLSELINVKVVVNVQAAITALVPLPILGRPSGHRMSLTVLHLRLSLPCLRSLACELSVTCLTRYEANAQDRGPYRVEERREPSNLARTYPKERSSTSCANMQKLRW